jgi:hypothetical protein
VAAQVNDLRKIRRTKKRRRFFRKLLLVIVIFSLAGAAYITREKWLPMFEGVVDKYKETIINDGKLAEGNFPVKVSTSSQYGIVGFDSRFAVLTDTNFYTFEKNGTALFSKQHSMDSPVMKTSGKRVLLYDIGGYYFSNESKGKTVYTKTLENQIVYAQISKQSYTAVVTKSDKYASAMTIYDDNGKEIFFSSNSQKIIDIGFNFDSTGCFAVTLGASGGQLVSALSGYSFTKDEILWKSQPLKTLVIDAEYSTGGSIAVIGDTQFFMLSEDGNTEYTYTYNSKLAGCSTSGDLTAVVTDNSERRRTHLTIISKEMTPVELELESEYVSVHVVNDKVYLLTDTGLTAYSEQGEALAVAELQNDYLDFAVIEEYVYLLGASVADRINFKS